MLKKSRKYRYVEDWLCNPQPCSNAFQIVKEICHATMSELFMRTNLLTHVYATLDIELLNLLPRDGVY